MNPATAAVDLQEARQGHRQPLPSSTSSWTVVRAAWSFAALAALAALVWVAPEAEAATSWGHVAYDKSDLSYVKIHVEALWATEEFLVEEAHVGAVIAAPDGITLHLGPGGVDGNISVNDPLPWMRVEEVLDDGRVFRATMLDALQREGFWLPRAQPWFQTQHLYWVSLGTRPVEAVNMPGTPAWGNMSDRSGDYAPRWVAVPQHPVVDHPGLPDCMLTCQVEIHSDKDWPLRGVLWSQSDLDHCRGHYDGCIDTDHFQQPGPPWSSYPSVYKDGIFYWDPTGADRRDTTYYGVRIMTSGTSPEAEEYARSMGFGDGGYGSYSDIGSLEFYVRLPPLPPPPPTVSAQVVDPTPCGQRLAVPALAPLTVPVAGTVDDATAVAWLNAQGRNAQAHIAGLEGSLEWPAVPAGRTTAHVTVEALLGEATDRDACTFTVDGVELRARMALLGNSASDASDWHPSITDRTWQWVLDGIADGMGPTWTGEAAPGEHEICLQITGTVGGYAVQDRACRTFVVTSPGPVAGDVDGDGVGDDADNCPGSPNRSQEDVDLDGLGDACDAPQGSEALPAPDTAPVPVGCLGPDQDWDSIPDACDSDVDGDRVPNDVDDCPFLPDPWQHGPCLASSGDQVPPGPAPRIEAPSSVPSPEGRAPGAAWVVGASVAGGVGLLVAAWKRFEHVQAPQTRRHARDDR